MSTVELFERIGRDNRDQALGIRALRRSIMCIGARCGRRWRRRRHRDAGSRSGWCRRWGRGMT